MNISMKILVLIIILIMHANQMCVLTKKFKTCKKIAINRKLCKIYYQTKNTKKKKKKVKKWLKLISMSNNIL